MKLRHLPPALFLLFFTLSLPSLTYRHRRHLLLPRAPSSSQQQRAGEDALLRRLATIDAGGDQVLADAAALLANASISSFSHSPGGHNGHRLLLIRLPCSSSYTRQITTVSTLRVPSDMLPDDSSLLAAFRSSLRSFLHAHHRITDIAGVMLDLPTLLGNRHRFPTCAVVGNSGILLNSNRGAQIDAHDFVIRLNNAPASAAFVSDVGAKTSLTLGNSFVLRRCSVPSASTTPGCNCHPYGRSVPLTMYVSQPVHLLDAIACAATATATSPFLLRLTDPRLDVLCARIAKYYSLRRFVAADTGEGWEGWRRGDGRGGRMHFHYSSGLEAVVMALGACEEVSMFGFGKKLGKKETEVHDYEAEYEFYRELQERPEMVPFLDEVPGFKLPPVRQYW
ncbi:hypothetical protein HU200_054434 [Digitaria exilis]|uniref:Uncharacterized protein n=1 Tax=Digitaria exilis TaxID=1010633 RepID=A0A835E2I7_9POAL|nr:hypothetical protein HU200_054434 [Digitaria exilis]